MKKRSVAGLALVLLFATAAWAQETTGNIAGTVTDSTGAVIPDVKITITNTDKNIVIRTVTTGSTGDYSAPLLPIGHYTLTFEREGFQKVIRAGIELNVNDRLTISVVMPLGTIQEQVLVEVAALHVDLQSSTAVGLISGTQVRELPLNNRNYIQLVTLLPGVSSTQPEQFYVGLSNPLSGGFNTLGISVNGQRTSANNWMVDGADNVDRGSNLGLLTTPSVDAIAEFQVLRSNYNAESGRSGASHVNVITRSGASSFHGSVYEFWRNDILNANSFFNNANKVKKPALRYHNFGWNLGGPVYIPNTYNTNKDKTFFFFSQEFRRVKTYSGFFATMPTADELQGTFANPVCVSFDSSNQCTGTYATTVTNISPTAAAYIQDIWSKAPLAPDPLNRLVFNVFRTPSNFRQETLKVDHVFGPRLSAYLRYLHDSIPTEEPLGLFGPNTLLPGVGTTKSDAPGWSLVGRATATLSPSLLLEAGYNYSYGAIVSDVTGLMNPANSPNVAAQLNLPFPSTLARLPTIGFSPASLTGGLSGVGSFGPYDDYNRNHQTFGNLTKIVGRHTFKFGATYYHYQKTENAASGNAGSFTFTNTGAQYPAGASAQLRASINSQQTWANFLQGRVVSFSQASLDLFPDVRAHQFELYGQDEFRLRPNLTLSYGLRYSIFRQPTDAAGMLTNFDPRFYDPSRAPQIDPANGNIVPGTGDPLNGIVSSSSAIQRCQQLGISPCWPTTTAPYGNKGSNEDNTNFAPRIGIAWDPWNNGKTSIRAGYGIFYDVSLFGIVEQNIFSNPPFVQSVIISNTLLDDPTAGVPVISAAPRAVQSRVSTPYDTPYTQMWSLDIQRELPWWGMLFDAGYYGNKGTHLIGILDINQPAVGAYIAAGISDATNGITATTTPRLNAIRPYLGYAAIPAIRTMFDSKYHSLQASLTKRFSGQSQFNIAYTWSKALTDNQTDRSTAPQNSYDIKGDYGLSQQDRPHMFTANFVYELPWRKQQQGWIGQLVGGWELSGIFSAQSGVPLTVIGSGGRDRAGQGCLAAATPCSVRPDMIADPNQGAPQTFSQWFNTSAFAFVPSGEVRPGSAARGAVRGPGFWRTDFALFKNIRFTEEFSGQFRFETFNIFNHTNPLGVGTTLGTASFARVLSTRDPRIIQLALKLNF